MIKQFHKGTVIKIEVEVMRESPFATASYYDPTKGVSISISELKTEAKKVDAASMTKEAVGKYYYFWQTRETDNPGRYSIEIIADDTAYRGRLEEVLIELI